MTRWLVLVIPLLLVHDFGFGQAIMVFVSPAGSNDASGRTENEPKKTIESAFDLLTQQKENQSDSARIILLPGEYRLNNTIRISDSMGPLVVETSIPGTAVIKGSKLIHGSWQHYNNGIYQLKTNVPISPYAQLYLDGRQLILARYPNYDSAASRFSGTAADALDPARIKRWKHPEGAIVHAMHSGEWGDFHYVIENVQANGDVELTGGHQNNRPSSMHKQHRMVENVMEELDAPGEWYFDKRASILYLYPPKGIDLSKAKLEFSMLDHLIEIKGKDSLQAAKDIRLCGIRFEHSNRTFMKTYEPLLRSDWTIYRGGAVFIENTRDCIVKDCEFSNLGGNALFVSGYNRNLKIEGNHIHECGASAISLVGDPLCVRSHSFTYKEYVDFEDLDMTPGPKGNNFPKKCLISNNLIHDIGLVEKQTAGVQISMAMDLTVSHNTIYDVPRAGINIGDGTWGGHVIEFNDVFNTVRETSDHGAFNSWGRDRFWHPDRKTMDELTLEHSNLPLLDAIHTTIIRNNRFRCDHGWDIDLDDGSSNYLIYNNLCLNGGIKLREGFYRTVENNVMINNGFHPHVWFKNSEDIFRRNIVMTGHQDIRLQGWGKEVNFNLFPDKEALQTAGKNGTDTQSGFGDPEFTDPEGGDFTVSATSPAINLGFVNFTMDNFGVQKPGLMQIARKPSIPTLIFSLSHSGELQNYEWLGAELTNIETMAERSAAGVNETSGVLVADIARKSQAEQGGLQAGDVVIECSNSKVKQIPDLLKCYQGNNWKGQLDLVVIRNQQEIELQFMTK